MSDYFAHNDVLVPLTVVLVCLKSQGGKYQFAGVPLARGTIAKEGADVDVFEPATELLQYDGALGHLAAFGLLRSHLLGLALIDNSE